MEALDEDVKIVSSGTRMEIYKEVGRPDAVAKRFHLEQMSGSHGIAHTRMATESAVTTNGAHPFSTGGASSITDRCPITMRFAGSSSATA